MRSVPRRATLIFKERPPPGRTAVARQIDRRHVRLHYSLEPVRRLETLDRLEFDQVIHAAHYSTNRLVEMAGNRPWDPERVATLAGDVRNASLRPDRGGRSPVASALGVVTRRRDD